MKYDKNIVKKVGLQDVVLLENLTSYINIEYDLYLKIFRSYGSKYICLTDGKWYISRKLYDHIIEHRKVWTLGSQVSKVYEYNYLLSQIRNSIPIESVLQKCSYVYFLFKNKQLVYIGETTSLGARLGAHKKDKDFDEIAYIEVLEEDRMLIESVNINYHRPLYNKSGIFSEEQWLRRFLAKSRCRYQDLFDYNIRKERYESEIRINQIIKNIDTGEILF